MEEAPSVLHASPECPMGHRRVLDCGVNLTHDALRKHWKDVVKKAIDAGVETMILTGSSLKNSRTNLTMARSWYERHRRKNLFVTVGVHPHNAKTLRPKPQSRGHNSTNSRLPIERIREMILSDPFAVAVGNCGLDFKRNFSTREDQFFALREQVLLACELQMPLVVHESEGHNELLQILDEVQGDDSVPPLPSVAVRCFEGTREEAASYVDRGFYIAFAGVICMEERGRALRHLLPYIPRDRILIETDAPFMAFKKVRRGNSEPSHVVDIAETISATLYMPFEEVCALTTRNANNFFRLDQPISLIHASSSPFCKVHKFLSDDSTQNTVRQTV